MQDTETYYHQPVMVDEVMEAFGLDKSAPLKHSDNKKKIVDATLGTGGHALEFINAGAFVLGIEWDKDIFKLAKKRLNEACPASEFSQKPFKLVNASYENIVRIVEENDFLGSDGVLMDLGVNSLHFELKSRGFSFTDKDSPLDMRFNPEDRAVDVAALLNLLDKKSLTRLFADYIDYKNARSLASEIVKRRKEKAIIKVGDLNEVIKDTVRGKEKLSVETLPFMALRIAVNTELENIHHALPKAFSVLGKGGVLTVISFHSGEDRVVKKTFRRLSEDGLGEVMTKRPKRPSKSEIENNLQARSARLRSIKKL
jgi:16S rRNA (cytosine1402-N4)-methyltransferase